MKTKKAVTGFTYFLYALLCFLGLGFDLLVQGIDYIMYGDIVKGGFRTYEWYMLLTHWLFVLIIWSLVIIYICHWIKVQGELSNLFNIKLTKKVVLSFPIIIALSLFFTWLENIIDPGTIPQIIGEYNNFKLKFGDKALLVSIAQNTYYIIEVFLVVLLLSLMQKAGEVWFKNPIIPYGAMGLAFTWGLGHLTHGGLATLWIMFFSLVAGTLFVLNKKNIWATYIFILLMFLI